MMRYYRYPYNAMYKNIYAYKWSTSWISPQSIYPLAKTAYTRSTVPSESDPSNDEKYYLSLRASDNLRPVDTIQSRSKTYNITASFHTLVETDPEEALHLINDENLPFSSLFLLRHDIEKNDIIHHLHLRNRVALSIATEIILGKGDPLPMPCSSCDYIQIIHSTLKWILETGAVDDGLSNEYDGILDTTATLLIKVYEDKTILPTILDMIFKRHAKGLFINDLVWTFFQSHEPSSLILIADRLKSPHPKDVDLARKLLSFCPRINTIGHMPGEDQYTFFIDWLKENSLFLYFSGETFQQSTNPIPYVVVLEAKYLYKIVDLHTGRTFEACTEKESLLLDAYKELDINTKISLSNFSYLLHQKDISSWKAWIQYPIMDQIEIARGNMGVRP